MNNRYQKDEHLDRIRLAYIHGTTEQLQEEMYKYQSYKQIIELLRIEENKR